MQDETKKKPNPESEALTDEKLDEVAGADGGVSAPWPDVQLPRSYPPWPGSS